MIKLQLKANNLLLIIHVIIIYYSYLKNVWSIVGSLLKLTVIPFFLLFLHN